MTIQEIYNLAINKGIEADFREKGVIEEMLARLAKKHEKMGKLEKEAFDPERLKNPFSDTRILFGDPKNEIKKVLAGIDIDSGELFLAQKIGADLVISHHPRGIALFGLDDVMHLQADLLAQMGISINVAEKLLRKKIGEVAMDVTAGNNNRTVDMAGLLNIPLACLHTPCDNMAARFIDEKMKKDRPVYLEDILHSLFEMPEYQKAAKLGFGPEIFVGGKENHVGKIVMTEMTGGTEGAPEMYEKLAQVGVGTIVGMHMSEKHRDEAEKAGINVVVAGHMSSDSLGMNLFMDELEKSGIEIIPCSGFLRASRN